MKILIKLSETHYIIVDDSEIKEGFCYNPITGELINLSVKGSMSLDEIISKCKKITHSTQPDKGMVDVTYISLSEVEEAINGYSRDSLAYKLTNELKPFLSNDIKYASAYVNGVARGIQPNQELTKDMLFTVEQVNKLVDSVIEFISHHDPSEFDEWYQKKLQKLLPKTEWEVEFDEQGKLKLIN